MTEDQLNALAKAQEDRRVQAKQDQISMWTQAAQTLVDKQQQNQSPPVAKFDLAVQGEQTPVPANKYQPGRVVDPSKLARHEPKWDVDLKTPKKPVQNAGGNPMTGAI